MAQPGYEWIDSLTAMLMGAFTLKVLFNDLPHAMGIVQYAPEGRVGVMPTLPPEAYQDPLFMEDVHDMVRMGTPVSDQDAALMWRRRERQRTMAGPYGAGPSAGASRQSVRDNLLKSIGEESEAARVYRERAAAAGADTESRALWLDVAGEEDGHQARFRGRLAQMDRG